jgi:hypothetical protein
MQRCMCTQACVHMCLYWEVVTSWENTVPSVSLVVSLGVGEEGDAQSVMLVYLWID